MKGDGMIRTFEEQRSALQKVEDAELKERVLRGLALLHERYGDDWVDQIDPAKFFLNQSACCVLGQTYTLAETDWRDALAVNFYERGWDDNPYTRHLLVLDLNSDAAAECGFEVAERGIEVGSIHEQFALLQEAWEAALGIEGKVEA